MIPHGFAFFALNTPNQFGFRILSFMSAQIIATNDTPKTMERIGSTFLLFSNLNLKYKVIMT
jgi:hypothetical protein